MVFEIKRQMKVARDASGHLRQLSHPLEPYYGTGPGGAESTAAAAVGLSPRQLADSYVRAMLPNLGLGAGFGDDLTALEPTTEARSEETERLQFADEKIVGQQATVSYAQTALGLPVWRSGFAVRMRGEPFGVIGSESSIDHDLENIAPPPANAPFLPQAIDAAVLHKLLALGSGPVINGTRLLIYRYDPQDRGNAMAPPSLSDQTDGESCPRLPPLAIAGSIESGRHYVVTEVLFAYTAPGWGPLNWRAFIEPVTGSALRVEALVSCVDGMVLERDPLTSSNTNLMPSAPAAQLDALRSRVQLPGVASVPGQPHQLAGPFVRLANVSAPGIAAPIVANGSVFDFSFPTDDFAAVNGYYHCDRCFRLLQGLGFDVASYFDGTAFPVPVDHRATINSSATNPNASAPGNVNGTGSGGFRFTLLAPGTTVGMAVEQRVTWHEFGHALLWDHLHSPNFPFAHSIGDTLAAILLDPDSLAPDKGRTFPWTIIARRHDRPPASGFAWGGSEDDTLPVGAAISHDRAGYKREQILSSTLFRFYRSIGGGYADIGKRRAAAQRAVWLLLEAIASLSPVAPPATAEDFLRIIIEADMLARPPVAPAVTGLYHKVLRWSFERQGLFQLAGAPRPVTQPGAPPEVDAFIDDGRGGGYDAVAAEIVAPPGLWCRNAADGSSVHEAPVQARRSFVFVAASNRGSAVARNVAIRVAAKTAGAGDIWPDGWTELKLSAAAAQAAGDIAPGQNVIFGPFEWTPAEAGEAWLFADIDCEDDRSNVRATLSGPCGAGTIAMADNNAAARRVQVAQPDIA
jgi:hypothetical protein